MNFFLTKYTILKNLRAFFTDKMNVNLIYLGNKIELYNNFYHYT